MNSSQLLRTVALRALKVHPGVGMAPSRVPEVKRFLFTDAYLGLDEFLKKRNAFRLTASSSFKNDFQQNFDTKGLQSIFSEDMLKFVDLAENHEDLEMLRLVLKSCIEDKTRNISNLTQLINMFFLVCHNFNSLEAAKAMWMDPSFIDSAHNSHPIIRLRYLALLYKNQLYREVVDEVIAFGRGCEETTRTMNFDEATLAMASLAKIASPEALVDAKTLYEMIGRKHVRSLGRMLYMYAWMAFKLGDHGIAYDLLTSRFSRSGVLSTNLRVAILADIGRIDDAFAVIRTLVLVKSESEAKRVMSFQVMKNLADAVTAKDDEKVSKEFASLCGELDRNAIMIDDTLEDMIFQPISQQSTRYQRQTRKKDRHKRSLDSHED